MCKTHLPDPPGFEGMKATRSCSEAGAWYCVVVGLESCREATGEGPLAVEMAGGIWNHPAAASQKGTQHEPMRQAVSEDKNQQSETNQVF